MDVELIETSGFAQVALCETLIGPDLLRGINSPSLTRSRYAERLCGELA